MRSVALLAVVACAGNGAVPVAPAPPDASPVTPTQLGAHWDAAGDAVDFRVASSRATRVELWLYDQPTGAERSHVAMTLAAGVWSAHVAAADATLYYGYRVWGPNWPYDPAWQPGTETGWLADVDSAGNRMNPNKLVFDPYARELSHDPLTPAQGDGTPYAVGSHRAIDSAPVAPKGIVLHDDPAPPAYQARALRDELIYEVHLRGFTMADAAAGTCAGTYAGAATRAAYLAQLGVTAIEFLPIHETQNDRNDVDPTSDSGDNYWGYSTLAYFAPDRRYACDRSPGGPTREFGAMVAAFHAAGIEVYLDVVYNHTAEGAGSALFSLRGLDNAGYYQLDAAGTGFTNNNGVGADVAGDKPLAANLVLDSLHYWRDQLGIDGFRFDLAPVLGNACGAGCFTFDPSGLPARIASELPGVPLIAEPWAVVANSYEVGKFPAGWSEWNDQVRDGLREDQNQAGVVAVPPSALVEHLAGSPDLYGARGPTASIDYLVSHDGLTLNDLYACNGSNNAQAWPYGPSDGGTTTNHSWDHGGDAVAQRQAARTGLALIALAAGVPMITGGDEMGRTLRCNNNSYNLDSPATWLDWTATTPVTTFAQRLFQFRAAHPALRPATWAGTWRDDTGASAGAAYLADATKPVLAWQLTGSDPLYVVYNRGTADVTVTLAAPPAGTAWYRAADTAAWDEPGANFAPAGSESLMHQATYSVFARSLVIFIAR